MEFCPGCGNMLQYELPNMHDARFFCPTCPYVAYVDRKVKIKRRQHLVKKRYSPSLPWTTTRMRPKLKNRAQDAGFLRRLTGRSKHDLPMNQKQDSTGV